MTRAVRNATVLTYLLLQCRVADAGVVEYHTEDRDQWFNDVGGATNITTIDFTGHPDGETITDQFSSAGVTFEGLNYITGPFDTLDDQWGLRIFNGNDLQFDQPINFIAADFLGEMQVELYDGDELFYTSAVLGGDDLGQFSGLVSERSFDRARLFNPQVYLTFLDDLYFGPVINVPGPGGPGVLVVVCGATLVRRRRRRG